MNIEYTDKAVKNYSFKDVELSEVFMVNGELYFRCDTIPDVLNKQWNSVNLETGYHRYFSPHDNVQFIKYKLTVEI